MGNKKNILFCSLAVLLIVAVAVTAGSYNTAQPGEFSYHKTNKQKHDNKITSTNQNKIENQKTVNTKIDSKESSASKNKPSYSDADLKRAQLYIDKNWSADKTINEEAYRDLGGKHTNYWDNQTQTTVNAVASEEKPTENKNNSTTLNAKDTKIAKITTK